MVKSNPLLDAEVLLEVMPKVFTPGSSARVTVWDVNAVDAFVMVSGRKIPMVLVEDGVWLGYISVTPLAETGIHEFTVQLFDSEGKLFESVNGEFNVLPVKVDIPSEHEPVEDISLPPDVLALLTPENSMIDHAMRFDIHSNISGPPRWFGSWRRPVDGIAESPFGVLRSFNGEAVSYTHLTLPTILLV